MSKRTEVAALKAYPIIEGVLFGLKVPDINELARKRFQQGYEQAEKNNIDLAQLWVDSGDANVMSFQKFLKCHETQGNK